MNLHALAGATTSGSASANFATWATGAATIGHKPRPVEQTANPAPRPSTTRPKKRPASLWYDPLRSSVMQTMTTDATSCFQRVAKRAQNAGVFGPISLQTGDRLTCAALAPASPAEFRIDREGDRLWISLVTADRWLSQSIEADLVHTGDKIDELLEEELADLGYTGPKVVFEHFRSEDKLFTFRTPLPVPGGDFDNSATVHNAGSLLLAYEACFRELGDMNAGADED